MSNSPWLWFDDYWSYVQIIITTRKQLMEEIRFIRKKTLVDISSQEQTMHCIAEDWMKRVPVASFKRKTQLLCAALVHTPQVRFRKLFKDIYWLQDNTYVGFTCPALSLSLDTVVGVQLEIFEYALCVYMITWLLCNLCWSHNLWSVIMGDSSSTVWTEFVLFV